MDATKVRHCLWCDSYHKPYENEHQALPIKSVYEARVAAKVKWSELEPRHMWGELVEV